VCVKFFDVMKLEAHKWSSFVFKTKHNCPMILPLNATPTLFLFFFFFFIKNHGLKLLTAVNEKKN
jgi:hypothetical protein